MGMKIFACALLAIASHAAPAPNSALNHIYGYKAAAGSNGDLAGPVHEVPALVSAFGAHTQAAPGDVSHRTGAGAAVVPYLGKREANPAVNYIYGYKAVTTDNGALKGAVHEVPALIAAMGAHIQAAPGDVTHHTGTGSAVIPYIGKRAANPAVNHIYGYKAVAGSNGDLAGAVHEVPALVSAFGAHIQTAPGDISHRTGSGAAVPYIGK